TTTFPALAFNINRPGEKSHKYQGKALAPVIPSFQLAQVWDKWSLQAGFALTGGGGKCKFDEGLGSFETPFSLIPYMVNAANPANTPISYSLDAYMKGRQYYFGLQVGAGYKISNNISAYLGLRAVYATCNYQGYVKNFQLCTPNGEKLPDPVAAPIMNAAMPGVEDPTITLNTDQHDLGWTPILGIDWKINKYLNIAAKYEFQTRMSLKNKTNEMSDYAKNVETLDQFNDEKTKSVREDIPAILTVGAQFTPISSVRIMAGYHFYFDRQAKKYNDKQDAIEKGTMEFSAGAEWDIIKPLTVSAGWQATRYRLGDSYMSDLSFNTSSNMLCVGLRIHATKRCSFDVGYMHSFYESRDVTTSSNVMGMSIDKKDHYIRSNRVFSAGVNINL
ncbi:MAG: transporter, partial [Bacteroidaceae bacterium]|nr:transporter [Bacteroidaceae bacterium]